MGAITLGNRFVMPAMQRGWCDDGCPTSLMAEYYRRRVDGGVSLIIGESCAVDHPSSTYRPNGAARMDARCAGGWARCVSAVREAGGAMLIQLWHEGAVRKQVPDDHESLSPSGFLSADVHNGRAATLGELDDITDAYVRAALLSRDLGASGVEIHCAHGYLLDLFLWAVTNRRTDKFGGDVSGRVAFPASIVRAIRRATGPDFVISVRFSQWKESDFNAQVATTPDELGILVAAFERAGADLLHVSARRFFEPAWEGSDLSIAGWTRSLARIPVITVGSVGLDRDVITNLAGVARATGLAGLAELGRRFLEGEFDLVAVGRCNLSDPEWVNKVRDGRFAELRPFVSMEEIRHEHPWEQPALYLAQPEMRPATPDEAHWAGDA